ncbi:MAG: cytochrome-c peroxidase [Bacteroidetes bacterium]|nr:cytochrome-c peroxidase [Bacteroidota bacterium]
MSVKDSLFVIWSCFMLLILLACRVYTKDLSSYNVSADRGFIPAPEDNPLTDEKIALGRKLFFDKRLSKDGSISCASCHDPGRAFSDNLTTSRGINGQHTERNAPSILNAAFLPTVMFDAHLKSLELQVIVPIQEPTEMGHNMKELIPILRQIPEYQKAAREIYNRDFDAYVLTRSISSFERSLLSLNSRYDQYINGRKHALSKAEKRGLELFMNELNCITCHTPPNFTNYRAENNGLYANYGEDKGRFRINLDSNDIGKFKVPSLRNILLTSPYMHDGSIKTIEGVISHYASGGKSSQTKHPKIQPFVISNEDKKNLISFLGALTDTSYLKHFR